MAKAFAVPSQLNAIEPYDRVLEIDDGTGQIRHFPLIGQNVVIGRVAEVDVQINNASVSRKHAELYCDRWGRWWVRDLGSSNGTRVNGFRTSERMLELADCIELGKCKLTLTMPDPSMDSSNGSGGTSIAGQVVAVHTSDEAAAGLSMLRQSQTASSRISALHLNQLMDMSQTLHRTEQQRERLRLLCELMVSEHFAADVGVVLMIPKRQPGPPQTLCVPQVRTGCNAQSLYITQALVEACKTSTEPTLVRPSDADSKDTRLAAMACPIRNDEEALVLLYLMVKQNCANEEWLTLASLAAEHFKQAEAAWVNRKLAKVNALVEIDLERARDIQMRLVPNGIKVPGMDVAIGFKPCRWVAGDYVDVLNLSNGRVLLVVADVCGKGLPASLVSSSLHTMVHAVTAAGADLLNLTYLLNRHLIAYLPSNRFVTAILIDLDPRTGQMQFINAGHPAPLLLDYAGNKRPLEMGDFEPLGLRDVEYKLSDDVLAKGQMLAMFTDGLTELKDQSGKMLTSVRLGDHLAQIATSSEGQPVEVAADHLNHVLDSYTGNRLQSDDRTFLLARR